MFNKTNHLIKSWLPAFLLPLLAGGLFSCGSDDEDTPQLTIRLRLSPWFPTIRNADGRWVAVVINYSESLQPFTIRLSDRAPLTCRLYRTSDVSGETLKPVGTFNGQTVLPVCRRRVSFAGSPTAMGGNCIWSPTRQRPRKRHCCPLWSE